SALLSLDQKLCVYEDLFIRLNVSPLSVATNQSSGEKRQERKKSLSYHHFLIKGIHHTYFGFSWQFNGKLIHYVFSRPLIKHWRSNCLRIVLFLDDDWCINAYFKLTCIDSKFVFSTLEKAGLLVDTEKSNFKPVQSLERLRFVWDLKKGRRLIPERPI
ncbi:hypothetical protein MAR_003374, partial [Mya arenaria]